MGIGKGLVIGALGVLALTGCGAHRMAPVNPQVVGDLKPNVEDDDGGLVGMRPEFAPKIYTAIVLTPFKVASAEIKDDEDARLAKDMTAYFQAQLVKRLEAAGIFARVIDGTVSSPPAGIRVLRLEGDIPKLTEGSQAARYFAGLYGAGAAKAQVETRLVDAETQRVQMITADRRAANLGLFGGDGRQFVTDSMEQMADGYVKLLKHLAAGGRPGKR